MAPSKKPVAKKPTPAITTAGDLTTKRMQVDADDLQVFVDGEPVAEEEVTATGEVDIEELPGGGTRETPRPSRRYSR